MTTKVTILQDLRRRKWAYLALGSIWVLAMFRVFGDHVPRLPVLYNKTNSLPYTFAYVRYGQHSFSKGDFIVFAFDGGAQKFYPGLRHQPFFKIVRGVPGDVITVQGREVFINGESVGVAREHGPKRVVLNPIAPGVIPPGYFYVYGTGPDSFDSRYALSGLVAADQVIAGVVPIF